MTQSLVDWWMRGGGGRGRGEGSVGAFRMGAHLNTHGKQLCSQRLWDGRGMQIHRGLRMVGVMNEWHTG